MTGWRVRYGHPRDIRTAHYDGDRIEIRQLDGEGTRRLEVWAETQEGEPGRTTAALTVGPDHVLGYEAQQG